MKTILAVMVMLVCGFGLFGCVENTIIPTLIEAGDEVHDVEIEKVENTTNKGGIN